MDVKELDEKVKEVYQLREDYLGKKAESDDAHRLYKAKEQELISILESLDKKSYKLDGICNVVKVEKMSVPTPKSIEDKKKFFNWIKNNYGDDGFWSYMTINSQTLNSLYNNVTKEAQELGKEVNIEGLELPTARVNLSIRKI